MPPQENVCLHYDPALIVAVNNENPTLQFIYADSGSDQSETRPAPLLIRPLFVSLFLSIFYHSLNFPLFVIMQQPSSSAACEAHLDLLNFHGVPVDADVIDYVQRLVASEGGGRVGNWLNQTRLGEMMDDHLLLGGLSELDFPLGTVVAHPNTAERILALAYSSRRDVSSRIAELATRFSHLLTRAAQSTILIPLCSEQSQHWGIVIVQQRTIYWGDSLRSVPFGLQPRNVVEIVKMIMTHLFPGDQWHISRKQDGQMNNYMVDVLGYDGQRDAFSCGFYVLATLCSFAASLGNICPFAYKPYDRQVSECYRRSCIRAYMERVRDVYDLKHSAAQAAQVTTGRGPGRVRVSDTDVTIYISTERMRFFTAHGPAEGRTERQQLARSRAFRYSPDDALKTFGVPCRAVADALSRLAEQMEFFHKRKRVDVNGKEYSKREVYACFKFREGCKVTATARYYPAERLWRVSKVGAHNHGRVAPQASASRVRSARRS